MIIRSRLFCSFWMTLLAVAAAGCTVEMAEKPVSSGQEGSAEAEKAVSAPASGSEGTKRIQVNGSSTVEKISTAVAEKFEAQFSDVQIAIKAPGTGTGFKEMIAGRVDIANASRRIKDSEKSECEKNGIDLIELKIALDGLSVCVSKENDWCEAMTVAELKKIWEPGSTVKTWKDVNPEWPAEEIHLFGAGEESGTFDYFTEAINGKEDAITENYSASADDNVILTGIAGDRYAMGFLGCAYYFLNKDKVRAVKISPSDDVAAAVELTPDSVQSGTYAPLSRPLFIYVKKASLQRQEVEDFVRFFLNEGQTQVAEVDYVPLNAADLAASKELFDAAIKK